MVTNKKLARAKLDDLMTVGGMTIIEAEAQINEDVVTSTAALEDFQAGQATRISSWGSLTDEEKTSENDQYTALKLEMIRAVAIRSGLGELRLEHTNAWRVEEQNAANAVKALKDASIESGYQLPAE